MRHLVRENGDGGFGWDPGEIFSNRHDDLIRVERRAAVRRQHVRHANLSDNTVSATPLGVCRGERLRTERRRTRDWTQLDLVRELHLCRDRTAEPHLIGTPKQIDQMMLREERSKTDRTLQFPKAGLYIESDLHCRELGGSTIDAYARA